MNRTSKPSVLLRFFLLSAAVILTYDSGLAAEPSLSWIRQYGTTEGERQGTVAADAMGSIYLAGYVKDHGLAGGDSNSWDAFLAKYDASGTLHWTRQLGSAAADYGRNVASDGFGGAYVVGNTYGDLAGLHAGQSDTFLAKYGYDGNLHWKRQLGTPFNDDGGGVAVDEFHNVYVSGQTYGRLGQQNNGKGDAFFAKYDSEGNHIWTRQLGTVEWDSSFGVSTDRLGNVYIAGRTDGSLAGENRGKSDVFLAKYTTAGHLLWSRQFGSSGTDYCYQVAADRVGNVFLSGYTDGDLQGNNAGFTDVFVTKFDVTGEQDWIRQFGSPASEESRQLSVDHFGNVFVSGHTRGSLGADNLGRWDVFLSKFDGEGQQEWILQFGSSADEQSYGISVDTGGVLYISGDSQGSLNGTNAGGWDLFLARIMPGARGDLDGDGEVDGTDFLKWQRGFGTIYSATDVIDWKSRFASATTPIASQLVPEPATWIVVVGGLLTLAAKIAAERHRD